MNNVVRLVDSNGTIVTIAGNGVAGYNGDGGESTAFDPTQGGLLNKPYGLAIDKAGNLYIADHGNHAIRIVSPSAVINTFAGNYILNFGYSGDGGVANVSQLYYPTDVAVDSSGQVYIADYGNYVIRQVTTDGNIHTYAGSDLNGYSGDGGAARIWRHCMSPLGSRWIHPATCTFRNTATVTSARWQAGPAAQAARSPPSRVTEFSASAATAAPRPRRN